MGELPLSTGSSKRKGHASSTQRTICKCTQPSKPKTPDDITVGIALQSPLAETGSAHDETSSSGNKEDEDDDDDESDDRIDTHQYDPERLKAFNVSLLVPKRSYV